MTTESRTQNNIINAKYLTYKEPATIGQALNASGRTQWVEAMSKEMKQLENVHEKIDGSVQLCSEQRPKQQTQLSLRGPYTEEAPSQLLQDELYRVDPLGITPQPHAQIHTRILKTRAVRTEYPKAELSLSVSINGFGGGGEGGGTAVA